LLEETVALVPEDVSVRLKLASARRVTGDLPGAARTLIELIDMYGSRRPKERALVHFELSRVALAKGDRQDALSELALASRIDPTHPDILHAQARLAFEEGELDRATRTYRSLLLILRRPKGDSGEGELSRAEVLFELSEIARRMDEPERAAEHLASAFEAAREHQCDRTRLLALLRERGRHDLLAAALEIELATTASGESRTRLLDDLALLYEDHLGRAADAFEVHLLRLTEEGGSIQGASRALDLGRRLGQVPRFVAALASRLASVGHCATELDLRILLARALEQDVGDDPRAAEEYLVAERLAADTSPSSLAAVRSALLALYARLGDSRAERALLERCVAGARSAEDPGSLADALYRLGALLLEEQGRAAEAIAHIEHAAMLAPDADRAEALLRRGLVTREAGPSAAHALERLARSQGRSRPLVEALVFLADHADRGCIAEPRATLPTVEEPSALALLKEASEVAMRLDDGALAERVLERVLERGATDGVGDDKLAFALCALADLRANMEDFASAVALRLRAARCAAPDPQCALLLSAAATARDHLGDLPLAARIYEELRACQPAEQEAWQGLAAIYRQLGDTVHLGRLLEETAQIVDSAEERAALRKERARMAIGSEDDLAVKLLTEVVEESPSDAEAATWLSELLEKLGRKDELTRLLQAQIDAAKDRGDGEAVGHLSIRLGELLQTSWDEQGALQVYQVALDWNPKNRDILRRIVSLAPSDGPGLPDALEQLIGLEEGEASVALALRLAEIRADQGDGAGAESAIERGFARCPTSARLREKLIRQYTENQCWHKLAELHARDADAQPNPADRISGLRAAARMLSERASDSRAAASILARAYDLEPTSRELLAELLATLEATGDHASASELLSRAIEIAPDDASLYHARAKVHDALGREDAMLLDLEAAHAKSRGGYATELIDALDKVTSVMTAGEASRRLRLRQVDVLLEARNQDRAKEIVEDLVRVDPSNVEALRALASIEEGRGDAVAAIAAYQRLSIVEDRGTLTSVALRLCALCENAKCLGEARGAVERALAREPENVALRARLREVLASTGARAELATMVLEDARQTKDATTRAALLLQAARHLVEVRDTARARSALEEARSLRPDDMELLLLLADVEAQAGRGAAARSVLEGALLAQRGRRAKPLAGVYRRVARIDLSEGNRAAALVGLGRALENDPQNAPLAMELGTLAVELGDNEAATRAFRTITMMRTSSTGSGEVATPALRGNAYYHLARMAHEQGDRRRSRLMVDKAIVDDPTLESARALLEQLKAGG
jgi:tetratricopeptide (TPR) repeat protein